MDTVWYSWIFKDQKNSADLENEPDFINFVRPGQKGKAKGIQKTAILQEARHWDMKVDKQHMLVFPDVIQTSLHPDKVIWSTSPRL